MHDCAVKIGTNKPNSPSPSSRRLRLLIVPSLHRIERA
eukprot:SAG31_NODE_43492_length_267_cov_0.589286_1_plen_37_part_10